MGKKLEMTQLWQGEKVAGVTKVQAGPCYVTQVKNLKRDGYESIQLGFELKKEKNINKPQLGHLKKIFHEKNKNLKYLREFREETKEIKVGDVIDVTTFEIGDTVKVVGTSKGKGFQGSVKRHGFHGHNTSHGTKDQVRTSGSIGAGGPQHVFKGVRMPGKMGDERVTVKNLKIVGVDREKNILLIKGAVPGARNGLVLIEGEGLLKLAENKPETLEKNEPVAEKKTEIATETTAVPEEKVVATPAEEVKSNKQSNK